MAASEHMSNDKEMMDIYETFLTPETVRLGDNREVKAYGKGTIVLKVNALGKWNNASLTDVLFVPNLAKNLFSVSAATRKGLTMSFDDSSCKIIDSTGTVLGSGKLKGKRFVLDAVKSHENVHQVKSAQIQNSEELWHQRFGHLGKNNLRLLQERKLVKGMNFVHAKDQEICVSCVQGKQVKTPFPKEQATRATQVLDIVHSDVCGPMKTKCLGGNSYFVTFIDEKSRYTADYFMERKTKCLISFWSMRQWLKILLVKR